MLDLGLPIREWSIGYWLQINGMDSGSGVIRLGEQEHLFHLVVDRYYMYVEWNGKTAQRLRDVQHRAEFDDELLRFA